MPMYQRTIASIVIVAGIIVGSGVLYHQKKGSADGRLLIWHCSLDMISDKPLFGHGLGAFAAEYMNYQANFFDKNPDSHFALLADNVKQPFNEYLKGLIQFGIVGMAAIAVLAVLMLRSTLKRITYEKRIAFTSLCGIAIFGLFSYPSYYAITILFISFNLFILSADQPRTIRIPKFVVLLIGVGYILLVCSGIVSTISTIRHEIVWNKLKTEKYSTDSDLLAQYRNLYLKYSDPLFLYNYGAVLNNRSAYNQSRHILSECEKLLNDCDLQIIQADNYFQFGDYINSERCALWALGMCPNRFVPLYQLMEIYDKQGQTEKARNMAETIINKKIKVRSSTVLLVRQRAQNWLDSHK